MEETREIEQASVPGDDLQGIKQRLQDWRAQRKPGERIPELLWAQAVVAARELGVYRVSFVAQLKLLGLLREFLHCLSARTILFGLEAHQVSEPDTPVLAGLVERQCTAFQQLDEVRARHVQHVGGFLRRQLGVERLGVRVTAGTQTHLAGGVA